MPKTHFRPAVHGFEFVNSWQFDATERQVIRDALTGAIAGAITLLTGIPGLGGALETFGVSRWLADVINRNIPDGYGLCGGMGFACLDYYHADLLVPQDIPNPTRETAWGTTLRGYIWERLMDSLIGGGVASKTLAWMAMHQLVPSESPFNGGASRLLAWTRTEWNAVKAQIDAKQPCPIGLVRNIQNPFDQHQIVVTGYDDPGDGTGILYVYDMNCPNAERTIGLDFRGSRLVASESCPADPSLLRGFFRAGYSPKSPPLNHQLIPRDGALHRQESGAIYVIYGGLRFHIPSMEILNEREFDHGAVRPQLPGPLDISPTPRRRGTLVQEGAGIHVLYGGARFHVPNMTTFNNLFRDANAVHLLWEGALANIATVPRDGTLLRETSGAIHVVYGGARFHVPNLQVFSAVFDPANVRQLWDGALAHLPAVPRDGTLLRETSGAIYVIYGGARFHVPDPATLTQLFDPAHLRQLWDGALAHLPTVPRDGTLLRETSGAIHVIYGGARFHIPNPATLTQLFDPGNVRQLWDGALAHIPTVPRDGTLLREASGAIHVIYGGARFHIPNPATLTQLFDPANVRQLWDGALAHISTVPRDGTLLRETSGAIYVIYGGGRIHVPSMDVFNQFFDPADVRQVWDGALAHIPIVPRDGTEQVASGTLNSDPHAVSSGPSNIDVYWKGKDGNLWHTWFANNSWHATAERVPGSGSLGSAPHAVSWGPGHIDVYWKGRDGYLWHTWFSENRWHGTAERVPGSGALGSAPHAVSWGPGHIDVYWKGRDGYLWHTWFANNSWHGTAERVPGSVTMGSAPHAVSWGPGHTDVYWKGKDGTLRHTWFQSDRWHGKVERVAGSGSLGSAPHAASWGPNHIDVCWKGKDGNLWRQRYMNSWAAPESRGAGPLASDPYPLARARGRIDVFSKGLDGQLRHEWSVF